MFEMKNKNLLGLLLLVGIFLFSIASITAGITLISPANGATVTGTYTLNATNSSGFDQIVNCTFYAKSADTANSSWTNIGFFRNNSANINIVNGTFSSVVLEDANNYYFNATCYNITNSRESVASTATIVINNTRPTAPSSLSPASSSIDTDGSITFSATVVDRETTENCVLYFPNTNPGKSNYTMTYSGSSCTYSMTAIPDQSYDYYIQASDGTDVTDSSTIRFNVNRRSSDDYMFQNPEVIEDLQSQEGFSIVDTLGGNGALIGWIVGIILVIAIGYIIFKK